MQASVKLSAAISPLIIRRPPWGSRRVRLPLPLTPSTRGPKLLPGTPPASDKGEGGQNPQKRPAYRAGLFFLIVSKSSKRKLCVPFGSPKSPRLSSTWDCAGGPLRQAYWSRGQKTPGGKNPLKRLSYRADLLVPLVFQGIRAKTLLAMSFSRYAR